MIHQQKSCMLICHMMPMRTWVPQCVHKWGQCVSGMDTSARRDRPSGALLGCHTEACGGSGGLALASHLSQGRAQKELSPSVSFQLPTDPEDKLQFSDLVNPEGPVGDLSIKTFISQWLNSQGIETSISKCYQWDLYKWIISPCKRNHTHSCKQVFPKSGDTRTTNIFSEHVYWMLSPVWKWGKYLKILPWNAEKKNHQTCKIFVKVKLKVKRTYFARCLLAPFSPRFPIFKQSLKGIWIKLRENIIKSSKDKAHGHTPLGMLLLTLKTPLP